MKEYRDFYFRKAKAENYPARSVYKLREIDDKCHILRPGLRVLDLGAAPGSWSLYAAEKIGASGLVLACDLKETDTEFPASVRFMREDVFKPGETFRNALAALGPFDLVMSDMAPATTGNRTTDQARSHNLAERAFDLASRHLRPGGHFVVKIFMGPDVRSLTDSLRNCFGKVKSIKPKSSRAESMEIFLAGLGFSARPADD